MSNNSNLNKEKLIAMAKNDSFLADIINQLHLNDEEIFYKFIDLMDMKLRELSPEEYMDKVEIVRNADGSLQTKRYFANNEKNRQYLLYNNLILKELGNVKYKKTFSDINFNEEEYFDLYEYQNELKQALTSEEKYSKLKGFFVHSNNNVAREKLLSSIANEMALSNKKTAYINVSYLMDEIKLSFDKTNNKDSGFLIGELINCDVLLLDNIGYEKIPQWFFKILLKLLDFRIKNNKLTFFGSETPLSELNTILEHKDSKDKFVQKQINRLITYVKNSIECEVWVG